MINFGSLQLFNFDRALASAKGLVRDLAQDPAGALRRDRRQGWLAQQDPHVVQGPPFPLNWLRIGINSSMVELALIPIKCLNFCQNTDFFPRTDFRTRVGAVTMNDDADAPYFLFSF